MHTDAARSSDGAAACIAGNAIPSATGCVIDIKGNGSDTPTAVRFSPHGEWLAVGTKGSVVLYDASTLSPLWRIPSPEVAALAFSPDDATLAVFHYLDGALDLVSTSDGRLLNSTDPIGSVEIGHGLAFSPDNSLVAAGSNDGRVRIWQVGSPRPLLILQATATPITQLIFSKDGTMLVGADIGRLPPADFGAPKFEPASVHVWRVTDGLLINSQALAEGYAVGLADGGNVLVVVTEGALQRWHIDTTGLTLIEALPESDRGCGSGSLFADELVFVCENLPTRRLSDEYGNLLGITVTVGRFGDRRVEIMAGPTKDSASVAVSPNGHVVVSASYDGMVHFWTVNFDG